MGASCRKKDRDFNELYLQHYNLVFTLLNRGVQNKSEIEDLAQELFERLWSKYDEIENVRNWIYGTIKNLLSVHYRNRLEVVNQDNSELENISTLTTNPRDTDIILQDAVNNIDFSNLLEKSLFDLLFYKQFTLSQIASALEISKSKAHRISLKVKDKLLIELNKYGITKIEDLL